MVDYIMILNKAQLIELTGKIKPSAQIRALRSMGIAHKVRPDGTPAVLESHIESILCGTIAANKAEIAEPNWDAMP